MMISRINGTVKGRVESDNAQATADRANALAEYIGMMSGIDLPEENTEEVSANEQPV